MNYEQERQLGLEILRDTITAPTVWVTVADRWPTLEPRASRHNDYIIGHDNHWALDISCQSHNNTITAIGILYHDTNGNHYYNTVDNHGDLHAALTTIQQWTDKYL